MIELTLSKANVTFSAGTVKEKEIEINGEKIKIALKLPKEEIEDNNIKIYLDDTIDLTKTIKEVKEETKNEQEK